MSAQDKLQKILIAYIALAKSELDDELFNSLDIPSVQRLVALLAEALPLELLIDPILMRHGLSMLVAGKAPEEACLHVFLLSTYRKMAEGSSHPLEVGIIRQQILGILPVFERAFEQGLITPDAYDKNMDALVHIAQSSAEVASIIKMLAIEYHRLETLC